MSEEQKEQTDKKPTKRYMNEFTESILYREMGINKKLLQQHFKYQMPTDLLNAVYNTDDKKENDALVKLIKSGLSDLKKTLKRYLKMK